jgi:transposase
MPKPLSNDLRKRIIDAKLRGDTEDKIASDKSVSKRTVTKLWALYQTTGSYEPRPNHNCRKPLLSQQQLDTIVQTIEEHPDITLFELIDKLCLPLGKSALSNAIRLKLGFRHKKNSIRQRTAPRRRQSKA